MWVMPWAAAVEGPRGEEPRLDGACIRHGTASEACTCSTMGGCPVLRLLASAGGLLG